MREKERAIAQDENESLLQTTLSIQQQQQQQQGLFKHNLPLQLSLPILCIVILAARFDCSFSRIGQTGERNKQALLGGRNKNKNKSCSVVESWKERE